jgi:hypothetical protein
MLPFVQEEEEPVSERWGVWLRRLMMSVRPGLLDFCFFCVCLLSIVVFVLAVLFGLVIWVKIAWKFIQ